MWPTACSFSTPVTWSRRGRPRMCFSGRSTRTRSCSFRPSRTRARRSGSRTQPAALESLLGHLDEIQAAGQACAERAPSVLRLVGHGSSDAAATYGVYAFGLVAGWTALRDSVSLSVYYGAEVDFSNSVVVALS